MFQLSLPISTLIISGLVGIAVLLILWGLLRVITGSFALSDLFIGEDLRASTSKFQWYLWTLMTLFAYVAIFTGRMWLGKMNVPTVPENVLIAMGLSLGTMAGAKFITTARVQQGSLKKEKKPGTSSEKWRFLVQGDDGRLDLSKTQIMAWTIIAVVIFFINVTVQLLSAEPQMPDIDRTLLLLMGLGQTGYLAKKGVTSEKTESPPPQPSPTPPPSALSPLHHPNS